MGAQRRGWTSALAVLRRMAEGLTNMAVSRRLHLVRRTVEKRFERDRPGRNTLALRR